MIVKLLTEHHLEFLSLKGGCIGSSESTHAKMPHCWKSHALAHYYSMFFRTYGSVVPCIERSVPATNNVNDWFLSLVFNESVANDLSRAMCRRFPCK